MPKSSHIVDVTSESFRGVLEHSHRVPVIVDFWAPWCGPCQTLMPMLMRLAEEYQGEFILAKVNIDEQQSLAAQFAVRSVPTVVAFRQGKLVDQFMGALPESQVRAFIDRFIVRESDRQVAAARALLEDGEARRAKALLEETLKEHPEHAEAAVAMAEVEAAEGAYDSARNRIEGLPANVRVEPQVIALTARLDFASVAANAPDVQALEEAIEADPRNSEARYQLAARHVLEGAWEKALDQLLELMRRDRSYGEDAGRNGMLKVFELLGSNHELVTRYRRLMASALY